MERNDLRNLIYAYIRMNKKTRTKIAEELKLYSRELDKMIDLDFANVVFKRARQSDCLQTLFKRIKKEQIADVLDPFGDPV